MRISDWSSDVCSSDLPARPPRLLCQSRLGEVLKAAKHERTVSAPIQFRRDAVQIDHAIARCHRQRMVETGPAILHGFALPTMLDLTLRARPEPACGQLRRASAHAAADIVAGDSQVRAVVVLAAQNDMPVEPGTEVALDLLHLSTSRSEEHTSE